MHWEEFDFDRYNAALSRAAARGERLYSAAYLMPPPRLGEGRKHANHLRLVEMMMNAGLPEKLVHARSLREVFELLRSYPAIGPFLAFQLTIDLNYSRIMDHSESDFVVAGPGARDGIRKCFGRAADGIEEQVIRYMADHQDEHFTRLGLSFDGLGHQRPLQLIDCQNLFCEVDKYARVAHPEVEGISGRHRIKQRYRPDTSPLSAWFPPKWGLNDDPVSTGHSRAEAAAGAGHPR